MREPGREEGFIRLIVGPTRLQSQPRRCTHKDGAHRPAGLPADQPACQSVTGHLQASHSRRSVQGPADADGCGRFRPAPQKRLCSRL